MLYFEAVSHFVIRLDPWQLLECSIRFWNWRKGWSVQKKALSLSIVVQHCKGFHMSIQEYCCKHEKKGCDDRWGAWGPEWDESTISL